MFLHLACDRCDREIKVSASSADPPETCPSCGADLDYRTDEFPASNRLEHCLVCGGDDLYEATQINPRFGVSIVVLGVVLFGGFVYVMPTYRGFLLGMSVLLGLAVMDRVLRILLPEVAICYRCKSVYSDLPDEVSHGEYDHELAAEIKYSKG